MLRLMKITVLRQDPSLHLEAHMQSYEVPFTTDEGKTVMDALVYIADHLDPTLGFFRHAACNHGICGRCAAKVNGKVRLTCLSVLDGDTVVEPKNNNIFRDLMTR